MVLGGLLDIMKIVRDKQYMLIFVGNFDYLSVNKLDKGDEIDSCYS